MILNMIADYQKNGFHMAMMRMADLIQFQVKDYGEMNLIEVIGDQFLLTITKLKEKFSLATGMMIHMNTVN